MIDILVVLSDNSAAHGLFEMGYKPAPDGSYILHTDQMDYSVRFGKTKQIETVAPYLAIPFYLSQNKNAANEFAQKKRELAAQFEHDPDAYQMAKNQLLDDILPVAMSYKKQCDKASAYLGLGMCLGCGVGMCFGVALGNVSIGMCIGVSVGMCLGLVLGRSGEKPNNQG